MCKARLSRTKIKIDENLPRATSDCKICNRRRIKCDRALPTCLKCRGRNLLCPGYGLQLKWDQGVASRGKLAGKSVPIRDADQAAAALSRQTSRSASASSTTSSIARLRGGTTVFENYTKLNPLVPQKQIVPLTINTPPTEVDADYEEDVFTPGCYESSNSSASYDSLINFRHDSDYPMNDSIVTPAPSFSTTYSSNINTSLTNDDWDQMPEIDVSFDNGISQIPYMLQDQRIQELLNNYERNIAPLMVWIDGEQNPWRTTILSLAYQCPTLLLSILAISAEHLSRQLGGHSQYSAASSKYRDTALMLITERLKYETEAFNYQFTGLQTSDRLNSDATLAAIIMLCTYEMMDMHNSSWRTHLDAAKTMIKLRRSFINTGSGEDDASTFLLRQALTLDAFSSTTTFFDSSDMDPKLLDNCTQQEVFDDFLKVMHQITTWIKRLPTIKEGPPPSLPQPEQVQNRFEHARHNSWSAIRAAGVPIHKEQDYIELCNVYHHAGLLYSWRGLYKFDTTHACVITSKKELFNSLKLMKDFRKFAQDLIYPLFILGAEAVAEEDIQQYVSDRMEKAMTFTGFRSGDGALFFLRNFWSQSDEHNWINFGRSCQEQGLYH